MRGAFDGEDLEQAKAQRDTEVTLGTGTLVLLVLGLVLICAVCFGAGYVVGHHREQPSIAASEQLGTPPSMQANASLSKPSASAQPVAAPPAQSTPPASDGAQAGAGAVAPAVAVAVPVQAASGSATAPASQPVVRPALPAAMTTPTAIPTSNSQVASSGAATWMVQIAAVSHQEDAEVLTGALRRRGYAVTARRDPTDNLIHVRVGPFFSRDEANRWRMKLLDDGYNALIQP